MKISSVLMFVLCGSMLSACEHTTFRSPLTSVDLGVNGKKPAAQPAPAITGNTPNPALKVDGGIEEDEIPVTSSAKSRMPGAPRNTAPLSDTQIAATHEAINNAPDIDVPNNDPSVTVYPIDGPVQNPMNEQKDHSVLDNTTAGGYTVFDESVKVYPLPGEEVPPFVPQYAVPPLDKQYNGTAPQLPPSNLPPVPTVNVGDADPYANPPVAGAVRQPLLLTAPEKTTLQPPSDVLPAPRSPFADQKGPAIPAEASQGHRMPASLTGASDDDMTDNHDSAPAAATTTTSTRDMTTAGRKSGPMLTGY